MIGEAKTEMIKQLEPPRRIFPPNLLAEVSQAAIRATKSLMMLSEKIKEYCAIILTTKSEKTIFDADFGIPKKILFEMEERNIPLNYLRLCLRYSLIENLPRLMHLATRHKNPRVRKKNQKRIRKMVCGN